MTPPLPTPAPAAPAAAAPAAALAAAAAAPTPTWTRLAVEVARRLVLIAAIGLVTVPLAPLFLVLCVVLGRPPVVFAPALVLRAARLALVGRPPAPGLSGANRVVILLCLLQRAVTVPLVGLAWHLDELLYGRALDRVRIEAPLFELSAARSGSTQLAHYLEDDPHFIAPTLLQAAFPFVWAWRLAPRLAGVVSAARVRALVLSRVPTDYLQRHEMDPFRTDTFEIVFAGHHLGDLFLQLGPDALVETFSPARITPTNRALWEDDFLPFLDRVARKTLLGVEGRRLLVKGHFLAVAPALAERYPDARFLTVLREPAARLRSVINFHRHQPGERWFAPVPWAWLVAQNLAIEVDYCDAERAFYEGGPRRHAVRFADYLRDLPGTLRVVYAHLGVPMAATLPTTHAHRARSGYLVDESLETLGVDTAWLARRLDAYVRWIGEVGA